MACRGRTMIPLLCLAALVPTLVSGQMTPKNLSHSAVLDAGNKYHIAWDFDEENITFEVSVQTLGYVGLGFSPNGGMAGSDIVIGWVDDSTGQGFLSDRHAVGESPPLVDADQNYTLLSGHQNGSYTVLRFMRKLNICSSDDYFIKRETVRLIWAYHEADPDSEGSISYHGSQRGNKNLYLLNPQRVRPPLPDDVITVDFLNSVTIPEGDTTYYCQAFPVPKLDRKHHMIMFEPVITPGHESEVHHIILYGCFHPVSNESFNLGHECYQRNMPADFWGCSSTVLAWAIGGGPLYLPEKVGLPIGDEGDPTMFMMETHYDNPSGKTGLFDTSGLRAHLTPNPREIDAGILVTGVTVGPKQFIPPFEPLFRTSGYCFPECLSQAMESQPSGIKVFGSMLHSHLLGRALRARHFRNGIEQPVIDEDNNYDFNFQETRILPKEVSLLPGDSMIVECDYDSSGRTQPTYGGLSTAEEMCLGYFLYYPKIKLASCKGSPSFQYLASFVGGQLRPDGTLASPPKYEGRRLFDVLQNAVDWTNETVRQEFQELQTKQGVDAWDVQCSDGNFRYPISDNMVSLPEIRYSLPEIPTCAGVRKYITEPLLCITLFIVLFM